MTALKCWFIRNFFDNVLWCNPEKEPFKSMPLGAEWLPNHSVNTIWFKVGKDKVYYKKRKV